MLTTKNIIKPVMIACSAGLFLTACATYEDDPSYAATTMGNGTIREASGAQTGWQAGSATQQQSSTTQQQQYSTQAQQQRYSGQQAYTAPAGQTQQLQSGDQWIIPLHEEQVNVGKRTVDAGTVTIRKIVTTETVSQPVQLLKETLVIDREGAGAQFQGAAATTQRQGTGAQAQAEFQAEPAGAPRAQGQISGTAFQEQTYTIQLREEQPVVQKNVVQTGQVVARKSAQTQRQNIQDQVRREDVRIDQGANAQNVEIRGDFDTRRGIREPAGAQPSSAVQDRSVEQRATTYQSETEIQTQREFDRSGRPLRGDSFRDPNTLDDINRGSNTRGGAEDLQRFDEKATRRP
ncbi:MAG: YsnF/AvaK domain-containing protein [Verrucomicrobia bacterium]|nr:YsnF/AvaK domain-containing protein [Verrucomicrobiota bacterium]